MTQKTGQIYLSRFRAWRDSMSDDGFRQIVYAPKGILNKQQIKKLADLSDHAIKKNPNIKEELKELKELKELEDKLRSRGVLPPMQCQQLKTFPQKYHIIRPYPSTRKCPMERNKKPTVDNPTEVLAENCT